MTQVCRLAAALLLNRLPRYLRHFGHFVQFGSQFRVAVRYRFSRFPGEVWARGWLVHLVSQLSDYRLQFVSPTVL